MLNAEGCTAGVGLVRGGRNTGGGIKKIEEATRRTHHSDVRRRRCICPSLARHGTRPRPRDVPHRLRRLSALQAPAPCTPPLLPPQHPRTRWSRRGSPSASPPLSSTSPAAAPPAPTIPSSHLPRRHCLLRARSRPGPHAHIEAPRPRTPRAVRLTPCPPSIAPSCCPRARSCPQAPCHAGLRSDKAHTRPATSARIESPRLRIKLAQGASPPSVSSRALPLAPQAPTTPAHLLYVGSLSRSRRRCAYLLLPRPLTSFAFPRPAPQGRKR
ncbi:hypothetical protein B0H15DRAFT_863346 [Mycena belliarum]|uniref:Uncharacterized protein n=1 Tax=Mycena belliarum TaxID=1033014 RepID=A0AAD6TRD0_9AGAR|nr:hypothetical protein B0H15DRAFT_863346 [Mycena belliae]